MKIYDLACYILQNYSHHGDGITPLKLQKLLFYAKAWGLVAGKQFVEEPFVIWDHGPVNKEIYHKFKQYEDQPIIDTPCVDVPLPNEEEKKLIDFILENYIDFHALTLSAMTHKEDPWKHTGQNYTISDNVIKAYYSKLPFAKNFPLKADKPFYPVLTDIEYSFIFDMNPIDAEKSMVFPSYNEYLKVKAATKKKIATQKQAWIKKLA